MQTKIRAIRSGGTNEEMDVKVTQYGALHFAKYLPKNALLAASGQVFACDTTGGTAAIPVVAAPTTSPEWGLYNANPGGGKSLVLLAVWCSLESGTAGLGCSLMIASAIGTQTVVSAVATSCVTSCLDGTSKMPKAYITSNPTLIGGTPSWVVVAAYDQIGSDGVGEGLVVYLDGLFIAPPKGIIGLEVVAETGTTAAYDVGFVFAEVQLDLG